MAPGSLFKVGVLPGGIPPGASSFLYLKLTTIQSVRMDFLDHRTSKGAQNVEGDIFPKGDSEFPKYHPFSSPNLQSEIPRLCGRKRNFEGGHFCWSTKAHVHRQKESQQQDWELNPGRGRSNITTLPCTISPLAPAAMGFL